MNAIQQQIQVAFRYAVHFTVDLFSAANPVLRDVIADGAGGLPARIVFIVDQGVSRAHPGLLDAIQAYCWHHADVLAPAAPPMVIPGGEEVKNSLRYVEVIHRAIERAGLCRHSFCAAVGGGAVLDAVGYAAATAHRGIRLIRIPTTVLSQDDSGVGVKNSVNAFGKKNFLGTFAPPFAVLNDVSFLRSLSDRDWRGGIAEAVKVALIKDAEFFEFLENNSAALVSRDLATMERTVRRCAELHVRHIATGGDPFELGSSRPLDFGHWAAHKLEQLTDYRLRHGEAVAIGMALDSTYSYMSGSLCRTDWRRIIRLLSLLGLPLYAQELSSHVYEPTNPNSIFRGLAEFREHLGGRLTIMLLRSIGQAFEVHEIDKEVMTHSIDALRTLEEGRLAGVVNRAEEVLNLSAGGELP